MLQPLAPGAPAAPVGRPVVGITLGDYNGVGPELILQLLAEPHLAQLAQLVVYASSTFFASYRRHFALADEQPFTLVNELPENANANANASDNDRKPILVHCWDDDFAFTPGQPSATAGQAAFLSLRRATADLAAGRLHAMVTAPINKATMPAGFGAQGHTDYLARHLGNGKSLMLMASDTLRVAVATDHVPLAAVPILLTRELLQDKLDMLSATLRQDFACAMPKIAVLALNPHAGEGGKMGTEEASMIGPLIRRNQERLPTLVGPLPADGFFGRHLYRRFDAVLALYHDQGLIPFKALAGDEGVNFTAGLPHIRTSPAHGTAYDIAGRGIASVSSFRQALYMAVDVHRRRSTS